MYIYIYIASIYLVKVNNRTDTKRYEIYSKLTIKNQNDIIVVILASLLLTLDKFHIFFYCLYC